MILKYGKPGVFEVNFKYVCSLTTSVSVPFSIIATSHVWQLGTQSVTVLFKCIVYSL